MRISFRGRSTPDGLVSEISEVLVDLAHMGVDQLEAVNLYVTLRANGQPVELRTHSGGKVDILAVQGRTVTSYAQHDPGAPRTAPRGRRRRPAR